jgi:DNA-3-methyladenine glycosylase
MFLAAGRLYVYCIHSRHCLNVVTEPASVGSAVLIRAIEPLEGLKQMADRRRPSSAAPERSPSMRLRHLGSGPGRLCEALDVDRRLDGIDLTSSSELWIESPPDLVSTRPWSVGGGARIGIRLATDLPLRWFIDGHQLVSGSATVHRSGRTWRFGQFDLP